jgi:hypothetical protein
MQIGALVLIVVTIVTIEENLQARRQGVHVGRNSVNLISMLDSHVT